MEKLLAKKRDQKAAAVLVAIAIVSFGLAFLGAFQHWAAGPLFMLAAVITWWVGLCFYASSKGYPSPIGLLCGLTGPIGLIVLLVMPDKLKDTTRLYPPPAR